MVNLRPITLNFHETFEFSVEDYLEYCLDYGFKPSQEHYKEIIFDQFIENLCDDINPDKIVCTYGVEEEYEFNDEIEQEEDENKIVDKFSYAKLVNENIEDLTEEELQDFHEFCEADKMIIHPLYTKNNIVVMYNQEAPSINYGLILEKETGEILQIKKSRFENQLYDWLRWSL
jgi:predicted HicB family RNase H-like nuclease